LREGRGDTVWAQRHEKEGNLTVSNPRGKGMTLLLPQMERNARHFKVGRKRAASLANGLREGGILPRTYGSRGKRGGAAQTRKKRRGSI